jgi:hypothetical protein
MGSMFTCPKPNMTMKENISKVSLVYGLREIKKKQANK